MIYLVLNILDFVYGDFQTSETTILPILSQYNTWPSFDVPSDQIVPLGEAALQAGLTRVLCKTYN
jgi:hypothetical protein